MIHIAVTRLPASQMVLLLRAYADTVLESELIHCLLNDTPPTGAPLDALIHQSIYNSIDSCQSILHAHNPYTIASTLQGDTFQPVDFEGSFTSAICPLLNAKKKTTLTLCPKDSVNV